METKPRRSETVGISTGPKPSWRSRFHPIGFCTLPLLLLTGVSVAGCSLGSEATQSAPTTIESPATTTTLSPYMVSLKDDAARLEVRLWFGKTDLKIPQATSNLSDYIYEMSFFKEKLADHVNASRSHKNPYISGDYYGYRNDQLQIVEQMIAALASKNQSQYDIARGQYNFHLSKFVGLMDCISVGTQEDCYP